METREDKGIVKLDFIVNSNLFLGIYYRKKTP
jgi:hypothetical protein